MNLVVTQKYGKSIYLFGVSLTKRNGSLTGVYWRSCKALQLHKILKSMKNLIKTLFLLLLSVFVFTSCDNETESTPNKPIQTFMAGSVNIDRLRHYAIATNSTIEEGTEGTEIIAITTSGSDVYAVGIEDDEYVVWKNGISTPLDPSSVIYRITDIAVSGSNVYVIGNRGIGPSLLSVAVLWTNGVPTNLSDKTSEAYDIEVAGNDVYVAGYIAEGADGSTAKPTLWKNNTKTTLVFPSRGANTSQYGWINSIAIAGNDVYAAGINWPETQGIALWKNNVGQWIGSTTAGVVDQGLAVNNNDVYIVGTESNNEVDGASALFKNGEVTFAAENRIFSAVRTLNGSVYVFEKSSRGIKVLNRQQKDDLDFSTTYTVSKNGEELFSLEGPYSFNSFALGFQ